MFIMRVFCTNVLVLVTIAKSVVMDISFDHIELSTNRSENCVCSDFVSDNGYGNCQKLLLGHPSCYVVEPSSCTDLEFDSSVGRNASFEACISSFALSSCFCHSKEDGKNKLEIMCQKNGTFKTASLCGSDEICIGPFTEKNAVKGITKLCRRGIFCGIDDALSLACNQCPKFNDSWCGGHCIFDELSQECKEDEYFRLEGKWKVEMKDFKFHPSFIAAKRYCTMHRDCFSIAAWVAAHNGAIYTLDFPVQLTPGIDWHIHEKKNLIALQHDFLHNQKPVCLRIKIKIGQSHNDAKYFSRNWKLDSCYGPKQYGSNMAIKRYENSMESIQIHHDRCCLLPGKYTLVCMNTKSTYGWGNVTFEINGKRYCDDFVGYKAMRKISVEAATNAVSLHTEDSITKENNFDKEAIRIELIPQRPNSGCPMGTFDSLSTCYCEDHCSWDSCKLFHPPRHCLEHMNGDAVWGWDTKKEVWVAQDFTLCINEVRLDSKGKTKDYQNVALGKYSYYQDSYGKPSFQHNDTNLYIHWAPDDYWTVSFVLGSINAIIYNPTCKESRPTKCKAHEWHVLTEAGWEVDSNLTLNCGNYSTNNGVIIEDFRPNYAIYSRFTSLDESSQISSTSNVTSEEKIPPKYENNNSSSLEEQLPRIFFVVGGFVGCIGLSFTMYSPLKVLREPKILIQRLKLLFKVACFLIALYFTSLFSTHYSENKDAQIITMRKFNHDENSNYPAYSICFTGARFHWFNNLELFNLYGLNATQYQRMIKGEKATRYECDNSFKLCNKTQVFFHDNQHINFNTSFLKMTDFVSSLNFVTDHPDYDTIISNPEQWKVDRDHPMILSYLSADRICFSRNSNDSPKVLRLSDLIIIDSSVISLYGESEMKIFVHYPHQLIRSFEKAKYTTSLSHLLSILSSTPPKTLEFKLTECKRTRKRHNSKEHCNPGIQNYDEYLIEKMFENLIRKVKCIPIYFQAILSNKKNFTVCNSSLDLKLAHQIIEDTNRMLNDNDVPCDEMLVLTIDSINNNPNPSPEDIGLKFYYTEKIFEEIQYIRAIPFENWLSNVGGFVGIFLGYSMIQFPEFLICLANIFNKNRIRNVSGIIKTSIHRIKNTCFKVKHSSNNNKDEVLKAVDEVKALSQGITVIDLEEDKTPALESTKYENSNFVICSRHCSSFALGARNQRVVCEVDIADIDEKFVPKMEELECGLMDPNEKALEDNSDENRSSKDDLAELSRLINDKFQQQSTEIQALRKEIANVNEAKEEFSEIKEQLNMVYGKKFFFRRKKH